MSFDHLAWFVILLWIGFRLALPFAKPVLALAIGVVVALAVLFLPQASTLMVAVLAPLGFLLPALAIRDVFGRIWGGVTPFHVLEIASVLICSILFIAASIAVFDFDPYRLGYRPLVPAVISLLAIMWAVWRRHFFVMGALLLAQIIWSFGALSSNFFDLTFHAMLVPVCLFWLAKTLVLKVSRSFRSAPVSQ